MKVVMNDEEFREDVEAIDVNNDGTITFKEFKKFMEILDDM